MTMDSAIRSPAATCRTPDGRPVLVAVQATDPVVGAEAVAYLRTRSDITPIPAGSADRADVILVVSDLISHQLLAWMQWVAGQRAAGEKKFVLIGEIRGPQLRRAASCGLVSVLPRKGCDYERTVRAILRLHDGQAELPGTQICSSPGRPRPRPIETALLVPIATAGADAPERASGAASLIRLSTGKQPHARAAAAVRPTEPAAAPAKAAVRATAEGEAAGPGQLEDRERDVLRLLADGFTTIEVADRLNYSERTVKNIIHQLLTRLNLRNRTHAVAFALRNGLL